MWLGYLFRAGALRRTWLGKTKVTDPIALLSLGEKTNEQQVLKIINTQANANKRFVLKLGDKTSAELNFANSPIKDAEEIRQAVAGLLGVSAPTITRLYNGSYRLDERRKEWELAVLFVRVFRSLSTYTPGTFEGWLHRITTNLFLDLVRRRAREGALFAQPVATGGGAPTAVGTPPPSDAAARPIAATRAAASMPSGVASCP